MGLFLTWVEEGLRPPSTQDPSVPGNRNPCLKAGFFLGFTLRPPREENNVNSNRFIRGDGVVFNLGGRRAPPPFHPGPLSPWKTRAAEPPRSAKKQLEISHCVSQCDGLFLRCVKEGVRLLSTQDPSVPGKPWPHSTFPHQALSVPKKTELAGVSLMKNYFPASHSTACRQRRL